MEALQTTTPLPKPDPLKLLSDKYQRFVIGYSEHGNASKAYRDAGYSPINARSEAYKLLRKPEIRATLDSFMEAHAISAGECIGRLSIWSRGNIEAFLSPSGEIDLQSESAQANMGQIKKYKHRKTITTNDEGFTSETTTVEIELYDAKDAVDKLLQIYGRYKAPLDPNEPKNRMVINLGDGVTFSLNG